MKKLANICVLVATLSAWLSPSVAYALDKQGSAHGGAVKGNDAGFGASGTATLGTSLYNPSYAARPDNSGLALFRYALHTDLDLIGRTLSIPLDLNAFTDRTQPGGHKLQPSELDIIAGLTSTLPVGPGALELGGRVEHDRPVDQAGRSQTYADLRARYLLSLAALRPGISNVLGGGDISGYATLGWFVVNPSYAARPDNSGLALFRYVAHWQIFGLHQHLGFGFDTTMFTDRKTRPLAPSEIDITPEIIGRFEPFEFHLAYERDIPLTQIGTLRQSMVYALACFSFDITKHK